MDIAQSILSIHKELPPGVKLVAVSKFHPVEAIEEAMNAGQTAFGENRPQEFEKKAMALDGRGVEWHFIGHLQTNKLKLVLPYASLVQSVDASHLLDAIDEWGRKNDRVSPVLL
ncbi:MAG: YggS family pyridoxal phosphate-dependent enzyme, partial [Bacteroidales bacterium]|nr:YggS family pyridoxal phosphate-dependent enzyme [Bacteroidales bacterium]